MDNNDLISREEATSTIKSMLYQTAINSVESDEKAAQLYEDIADNRIETWLGLVDSVDAAPVVYARWKVMGSHRGLRVMECSNCKKLVYRANIFGVATFCPNCGAKMGEHGKDAYIQDDRR